MIENFELTSPFDNSVTELVKVIHNEDEYTIMTKAEYDRQQTEQSTPSLTDAKEL